MSIYDELYEVSDEETPGKKTYYKGQKQYVDVETGEIVEADVLIQEIKHSQKYFKGWRRVYLFQLFDILLDLCGNSAKLRVIDFIMDNLDSNNHFNMSQRQAHEKMQKKGIKASWVIVNQTFQALEKANAMVKSGSIYILNPKLANAFGSDRKNRAILLEFQDAQYQERMKKIQEQEQREKAEKISNAIKEIA